MGGHKNDVTDPIHHFFPIIIVGYYHINFPNLTQIHFPKRSYNPIRYNDIIAKLSWI